MPNPHRGEIEACLDGKPFRLCLTLGSLAELEHAFGHEDMLSLAERFQSGRLSARDAQRIIGAGLRGAGHEVLDDAVGRMQTEGGAAGFVDIVARLLTATFGGGGVRPSGSDTMAAPSSRAVNPRQPDPGDPTAAPSCKGVGPGGSDTVSAPAEERTPPAPFPGAT